MLPWSDAKIIGVFGECTGEALALLRIDARSCGVRAITVVDTGCLPANVIPRRFVRRHREIANATAATVLIDLRLAGPVRLKAILQLADYGVSAIAEVSGPRLDLITRDGFAISLPVSETRVGAKQ